MTTAESSPSEVPRIASSSQSDDKAQGATAVTQGNVTAVWRAWWTWSPGNGTHNLQLPWSVIGPDSTVVVTAAEIDGNGRRLVGSAPFQVSSIAPGNGVVTFKIAIGWNSALPMRTDVLVFN